MSIAAWAMIAGEGTNRRIAVMTLVPPAATEPPHPKIRLLNIVCLPNTNKSSTASVTFQDSQARGKGK
jgi:hypothetical protein